MSASRGSKADYTSTNPEESTLPPHCCLLKWIPHKTSLTLGENTVIKHSIIPIAVGLVLTFSVGYASASPPSKRTTAQISRNIQHSPKDLYTFRQYIEKAFGRILRGAPIKQTLSLFDTRMLETKASQQALKALQARKAFNVHLQSIRFDIILTQKGKPQYRFVGLLQPHKPSPLVEFIVGRKPKASSTSLHAVGPTAKQVKKTNPFLHKGLMWLVRAITSPRCKQLPMIQNVPSNLPKTYKMHQLPTAKVSKQRMLMSTCRELKSLSFDGLILQSDRLILHVEDQKKVVKGLLYVDSKITKNGWKMEGLRHFFFSK